MSFTYAASEARTYAIVNPKYLASKIKTDLMRLHHYYYETHGSPSEAEIEKCHDELVLLQELDLLHEIEYGFYKDGKWIKALKYAARQGGVLAADDSPGGIKFSHIPEGAGFGSFLLHSHRWNLPSAVVAKREFLLLTPVRRVPGNGYSGDWVQHRAYSSGGRGLLRSGI